MSFRVFTWAFDEVPDLSGTPRLVLLALADYADDEGYTLKSRQEIAKRVDCSFRQVDRAISALRKRELVSTSATYQWCDATSPACINTGPHKHRSATTYRLHAPLDTLKEDK